MIKLKTILLEQSSNVLDQPFIEYIKDVEGTRKNNKGLHRVYKDKVGKWTIGYGHTGPDITANTKPIDNTQAEKYLITDLQKALKQGISVIQSKYPGTKLDKVRKQIVTDFAFNLGKDGFSTKFPKLQKAIANNDWSGPQGIAKEYTRTAKDAKTGIVSPLGRNKDFCKFFNLEKRGVPLSTETDPVTGEKIKVRYPIKIC